MVDSIRMLAGSSNKDISQNNETSSDVQSRSSPTLSVLKRNYVLNDSNALKKKLKNESRSEPYNLGTEARDGSNMVIQMKTTFFEHTKAEFLKDLLQNADIEKVDNAIGAKVTSNSGEAFVEFSVDVFFRFNGSTFVVKLTAYTTSCRLMIQGERTKLGNKFLSRYFVDHFLLPWCQAAYSNKTYNEEALLDAIHTEIKRLDLLKLEAKKAAGSRNKLPSVASSEVKCVARGCKYTGINSGNKSAVGTCCKCGCFEHYECSKTKQEDREQIVIGRMQYFCSQCFMRNPSSVAFERPLHTLAITNMSEPSFPCDQCQTTEKNEEDLKKHKINNHSLNCSKCTFTCTSEEELNVHIVSLEGENVDTDKNTCDEGTSKTQAEVQVDEISTD